MYCRLIVRRCLPLAGMAGLIHAETVTWNHTESSWHSPAAWSPGKIPAPADEVVFPAGFPGVIYLSFGETAGSLRFDSGMRLSGGSLTLGSGAVMTTAADTTSSIWSELTAPGKPVKRGQGTLVLNAANSMSQGMLVEAGTLRLTNADAAGAMDVGSSAVLDLSGNFAFVRPVRLQNNASLTGTGAITMGGTVTVDSNAVSVSLSGRDVGSALYITGYGGGGVTTDTIVSGPGTVSLSGNSAYAGNWTVDESRLELRSPACLGANNSGHVTLNRATLICRSADSQPYSGPSGIVAPGDATIRLQDGSLASFPRIETGSGLLLLESSGSGGTVHFGVLRLTGNPEIRISPQTGYADFGAIESGGTARTVQFTGNGGVTLQGPADLPPGSRLLAGARSLQLEFPPLGAGAVVSAAGKNPAGQAVVAGQGTIRITATGSTDGQTFDIGTAIEASGDLTFATSGWSNDYNKTVRMGSLTMSDSVLFTLSTPTGYTVAFPGGVFLHGNAELAGTPGLYSTLTLGALVETNPGTITFSGTPEHQTLLTAPSSRTGPVAITGGTVIVNAAGACGTGPVSVSGGTLRIPVAGGLSSADTVRVSNGGTLDVRVSPGGQRVSLTGGTLSLASEGSAAFQLAELGIAGNCLLESIVTGPSLPQSQVLNAPLRFSAGSSLKFSQSGWGALTTRLEKPVELSGDAMLSPSFSGNIVLLAGGIREQSASAVTLGDPLDAVSGGSIYLDGPGTWTGGTLITGKAIVAARVNGALGTGPVRVESPGSKLSVAPGASLTAIPSVEVSGGTLELQHLQAGGSVPITFRGGALRAATASPGTFTGGGLTFDGGTTRITADRIFSGTGSPGSAVNCTLGPVIVRNLPVVAFDAAQYLNRPALGPILLESDLTLDVASALLSLAQDAGRTLPAVRESGGPRRIVRTGFGSLSLSAPAIHTGGWELKGGSTLLLHNDGAGSGPVILNPDTFTYLRLSSGITMPNAVIVAAANATISSTSTVPASSAASVLSGSLTVNAAVDLSNNLAGDLVLSGVISGSEKITTKGTGTIMLSNPGNTFGSGAPDSVTLSGGILAIPADQALGHPANGLTFAGTGTILRPLASFSSPRRLLFTSSGVIDVPEGVEFTAGGERSGTGSLTKTGAGSLTLAGTGAGAGSVRAESGILLLGASPGKPIAAPGLAAAPPAGAAVIIRLLAAEPFDSAAPITLTLTPGPGASAVFDLNGFPGTAGSFNSTGPGCTFATGTGGTLSVSGNFQQTGGGSTVCLFGAGNPLAPCVTAAGNVGISGTIDVNIEPGAPLAPGQRLTIIRKLSPGLITGAYSNAPEGAAIVTPSGFTLLITYAGGDGNDLTATVLALPGLTEPRPTVNDLTALRGTGGNAGLLDFTLKATGLPGLSHVAEASGDLMVWQLVQTLVSDNATGTLTFQFSQPLGQARFFRVRRR